MPFPRKLQLASLPRAALGTRIIIRPGEDGGVVTLSEFMIAELASDERFRKMTTNRIIAMLKRKDFAIGDIRTDRIQHIEKLISKADGGTPHEYDLWREGDGKQDLTLYLRRLVPIMGCLVSDKRFAGHQYLEFDLRERDGCRVFGPANGSLWWQINQERVGADRVLRGSTRSVSEQIAFYGLVAFLDDRKAARMTCRAPRGMEGVTCRARCASRTRIRTRTQAPAHARAPAPARPRARTAAA